MSKTTRKPLYGFGINDADYSVSIKEELPKLNGKRNRKVLFECPFYVKWKQMLERCFSVRLKSVRPSYQNATCCQEWLTFSNFKSWMEKQDWQGKELDKDLLVNANQVYCPENCVFISRELNGFLREAKYRRGDYLIGVDYHKSASMFRARCGNDYLGLFNTELEALLAWKRRKHELACLLAEKETDPRIIHALTTRYAGDDIYEA